MTQSDTIYFTPGSLFFFSMAAGLSFDGNEYFAKLACKVFPESEIAKYMHADTTKANPLSTTG